MAVTVEELNEARNAWRESQLDLEQALDERFLEELEDGKGSHLAAAKAKVACHSLLADTASKLSILENLAQEYVAHGDAELNATHVLNRLGQLDSGARSTAIEPSVANQ